MACYYIGLDANALSKSLLILKILFKYKNIFSKKLRFEDGVKLCMKQYERILTSHRIPGNGTDTLKTWNACDINSEEHIIVLANNYVSL